MHLCVLVLLCFESLHHTVFSVSFNIQHMHHCDILYREDVHFMVKAQPIAECTVAVYYLLFMKSLYIVCEHNLCCCMCKSNFPEDSKGLHSVIHP